jgi:hypothetical protein
MLFRYNLLLGYHTYQFFPGAKVLIIDTVGWKFPVLTFIGGVYGSARLTENWLLAFISASLMFLWATFILFVINGRNSYPTGFNEVRKLTLQSLHFSPSRRLSFSLGIYYSRSLPRLCDCNGL